MPDVQYKLLCDKKLTFLRSFVMVWLKVYAIMIFRYDLIILDVGTLERIVTSSTVGVPPVIGRRI